MKRLLLVAVVVIVALAMLGGSPDDACDVAENWRQPDVCD